MLALAVVTAGCTEADTRDPDGDRREVVRVDRPPVSGGNSGDGPPVRDGAVEEDGASARRKDGNGTLATTLFAKLRVSPEVDDGYDRDLFDHWDDRGPCDVREVVLARQDRRKGPCGTESGRWFSVYDGVTTTDPGEFDIDHMVPLAEAWASGARGWPEVRRDAFANDLAPYSLIAVSASSNRSKSDRDPAEWMPENEGFTCSYIARWIAVKFRWRLSVDAREKAFLSGALAGCRPAELRLKDQSGDRR